MADVEPDESNVEAPSESGGKIGRFLSVTILSQFMRITYGKAAVPETQRRIASYTRASKHDLAEIWQRVLVQLTGHDPGAETRLVVKAKRSLRIKASRS